MNENSNLKLVQSGYAAYLRGDVEGIIALMDPSIVFTVPGSPAVPNSGTYNGHAGMRQFFQSLDRTLEFSVFEPREFIAQGDKVVALVHYEGRYKQSGGQFAIDSAMVWTVQNGKLARFVEYTDTEAAANAARGAMKSSGAA